ncbi:MAG: lipoate--protein ligase [Clostridia bacterium]|nr:lipoate--protein ligase [Clostridia bacterium]
MKLIRLDSINPYFNLAAEEYFLKTGCEDKLILWQNDNTVVIGKNQSAFTEINHSRAEEMKVNIVRRMSGGGAVYHDLGNLNYTYITKAGDDDFLNFKKFTKPVIDALKSLGIDATLSGRNDMLIGGKKFSGNAQYVYKDMLLHHGTLMFSTSVDILAKVLNVNELKIKSKGIASVKSRVTNIRKHCDISIDEFCELLFKSAEGTRYQLTQTDLSEIKKLQTEKYETWEWNFGYSPKHSFKNEKLFPCGIVSASLDAKDGKITDIKFSGDFFGKRDISELEQALIGVRHDYNEILSLLKKTPVDEYFSGLTYTDIADLIKP